MRNIRTLNESLLESDNSRLITMLEHDVSMQMLEISVLINSKES